MVGDGGQSKEKSGTSFGEVQGRKGCTARMLISWESRDSFSPCSFFFRSEKISVATCDFRCRDWNACPFAVCCSLVCRRDFDLSASCWLDVTSQLCLSSQFGAS